MKFKQPHNQTSLSNPKDALYSINIIFRYHKLRLKRKLLLFPPTRVAFPSKPEPYNLIALIPSSFP